MGGEVAEEEEEGGGVMVIGLEVVFLGLEISLGIWGRGDAVRSEMTKSTFAQLKQLISGTEYPL